MLSVGLNGFKSSKVEGFKWASDHHAAIRYAGYMDGLDGLLKQLFLLTTFSIDVNRNISHTPPPPPL